MLSICCAYKLRLVQGELDLAKAFYDEYLFILQRMKEGINTSPNFMPSLRGPSNNR